MTDTTTTRPSYADVLPLTSATVTPAENPPTGTLARYVGSLGEFWRQPVRVDGLCVCSRCLTGDPADRKLILTLPDGKPLIHARFTSIRVAA